MLSVIVLAIALSMDAFATTVSLALRENTSDKKKIVFKASLCFAIFQGVMPIIGWIFGSSFIGYIDGFEKYISFGIFFILGCKMLYEGMKQEKEESGGVRLTNKDLLGLGIATSIDALFAGITITLLGVNIIIAAIIIAFITFIACIFAGWLGEKFSSGFSDKGEIIGGIVLILLAVKALF